MSMRNVQLPVRTLASHLSRTCSRSRFSTSTACHDQNDPARALMDNISPAKTPRPSGTPVPSPGPEDPPPDQNPALAYFPNVEKTPLSPADKPFKTIPEMESAAKRQLFQMLRKGLSEGRERPDQPTLPKAARQQQGLWGKAANRPQERAMENMMTRSWRIGDCYAPHDLSPAEQLKARHVGSRTRAAIAQRPRNTRRRGWSDIMDELAINPLHEYKNFSMMSEYMTEMGRVKHGKDTGLRNVNQRKLKKAIRRAIGIGIMPSVHRHPELFAERVRDRGQTSPRMS